MDSLIEQYNLYVTTCLDVLDIMPVRFEVWCWLMDIQQSPEAYVTEHKNVYQGIHA